MRHGLLAATVLTLLAGVEGNAQLAESSRVRLRPRGPDSPWVEGRLQVLSADSVAVRLAGGPQTLHLRPAEARLERDAGRDRLGSGARGAVIGAVAMLALPLFIGENIYQGEGILLGPAFALVGGALGGVTGALVAPTQWVALNPTPPPCSRWRLAAGSPASLERGATRVSGTVRMHDEQRLVLVDTAADRVLLDLELRASDADAWRVELPGTRNRRGFAAAGALVLGGIAVVGASTDASVSLLDGLSAIGGNAVLGAALGAWWAPLRRHPTPLSCPGA